MVYSFDVFDTCLIRACGLPIDLFDILGYRILGEKSSSSSRMEFRRARMEAEHKARTISKEEEITIKDIYDNLDIEYFNVNKDYVLQCELELEELFLQPCYEMCKRISEIHQKGLNVLFISDMYLPCEFIKRMLCKHGFWMKGDELYVSSVIKRTKRTGNLYNYISKKKNFDFENWFHFGDNRVSDYLIPKRLGIKVNLIRFEFPIYQKKLLTIGWIEHRLPYKIAMLSKSIVEKYSKNCHTIFCADLIAPLFVSFVYRVMSDARKNGVKNIFFLARDSYKFYQIALSFKELFSDLSVNYLYVSRRSLYFPSLTVINSDTILSVLGDVRDRTLIDIFNDLHIDLLLLDKIGILKKESELPLCGDNFLLFCKVFSNPIILHAVSVQKEVQKKLLFEYFLQSGLASSQKSAIVDLRGSRTCHKIINGILSDYHYPTVYGYYFEVLENRLSVKEAGDYDSIIYDENFAYNYAFGDYRNLYQVLEAYFALSNHRRTISYEKKADKIYPVFDSNQNNLIHISDIHLKVIEDWSFYFKKEYLYLYADRILEYSIFTLLQFSNKPNSFYLEALNDVGNRSDGIFMVRKLNLRDCFYLLFKKKHIQNEISWRRGALCYSIPGFYYMDKIVSKFKYLLYRV